MVKPDGFVSLPLTKRQVEIYLWLVKEGISELEMYTNQLLAMAIDEANTKKVA